MPDHAAREDIFDQLIAEAEQTLDQLKRTVDGLMERIALETRHIHLLQEKRAKAPADNEISLRRRGIACLIAGMLVEKGEPMRPAEIAEELARNGIPFQSRSGHLPNVLSTLCRRSDLFVRVERGLYTTTTDGNLTRSRRSDVKRTTTHA